MERFFSYSGINQEQPPYH